MPELQEEKNVNSFVLIEQAKHFLRQIFPSTFLSIGCTSREGATYETFELIPASLTKYFDRYE